MTQKNNSDGIMNPDHNVTENPQNETVSKLRNTSSSSKKMAAKSRQVSLADLVIFLDRDRNTIVKWVDNGLPYIEKADRDLGKPWIFDSAEVVRWLEKRAADVTAEKLGDNALDGKTSTEEAKRRRAVAEAVVSEIEAAEAIRTVVRVSHIVEKIASDYSEIRNRLISLPAAIAGRIDATVSQKVKDVADERIRIALKALRTDKDLEQ